MEKNKIIAKEIRQKRENRYLHVSKDGGNTVHEGETVEQFLARGGSIKTFVPRKSPLKNENGKFVKGCNIEIVERKTL